MGRSDFGVLEGVGSVSYNAAALDRDLPSGHGDEGAVALRYLGSPHTVDKAVDDRRLAEDR